MELVKFFGKSNIVEKSNIRLAKEGDKEAFTSLMQENLKSMYRVAKGILKREEDVEDGIQNTILIAFNKLGTLKEEKYFKTWLTRILINECNKIYEINNKKHINVEEEAYTVDETENIDLFNAISKLPNEIRVTTILFYFDDMSYKDIAKILGIAEGTVKSRLFRAKERLYTMLNDSE
ncbi:RNA polymerase sigma factor [Clostridium sp. LP20]|uniref:RNA polymerase sigma factor n=1 Tax=Clostridium sp. LP20 TaxID=3418665 RepID=UPI003EE6E829